MAGAGDPLNDWARRTVPGLSVNLNAVAFGNGAFVAVGNNSTVARSTDGINWTVAMPGAYGNLFRVRFLEGEFVVVGSSDRILVSTDGLSWTERTLPSANFYDIAYGNGRYVIIGSICYVSTNGTG